MAGKDPLFLGVDGGGSFSRVRLTDAAGQVLGAGTAGSANIRLGLGVVWEAVLAATDAALTEAGLDRAALPQLHAGLGLAGILGPADLDLVRASGPGFASLSIATDAHIACLGAFAGRDGGIVIIGTGSVGYALIGGVARSVGGWGFAVSDLGSGADIGREAVRAALQGHDGIGVSSGFTAAVLARLGGDPAGITAWAEAASPRDYAEFARDAVDWAGAGDPIAAAILARAAGQIEALIARLHRLGAAEICLMGGLGPVLAAWLPAAIQAGLSQPAGDALDGALRLARAVVAAQSLPCVAS